MVYLRKRVTCPLFYLMAKTQKYGIKFPININDDGTFFALDKTEEASIKSEIMHLLFTPMGQRLRKPLFGSKLIEYIFQPNDALTWSGITSECQRMVSENIPGCSIDSMQVYDIDDGRGIVVSLKYSVANNGEAKEYDLMVKI